jgi:hypothetical protein
MIRSSALGLGTTVLPVNRAVRELKSAGYSAVVQLICGFSPAVTKPLHDRVLLG